MNMYNVEYWSAGQVLQLLSYSLGEVPEYWKPLSESQRFMGCVVEIGPTTDIPFTATFRTFVQHDQNFCPTVLKWTHKPHWCGQLNSQVGGLFLSITFASVLGACILKKWKLHIIFSVLVQQKLALMLTYSKEQTDNFWCYGLGVNVEQDNQRGVFKKQESKAMIVWWSALLA